MAFYRDATSGAVYSVNSDGTMHHVTPAEWNALPKSEQTYTNYTMNPQAQSAMASMLSTLNQWGLASLAGSLQGLLVQGLTSTDQLSIALQSTPAYKQRFAGNEARIQKGLAALSPADYLSLERQYRNVLQSYGLPAGFYDSPTDFTNFIANDISPSELDARAKVAHDQYESAPTYVKNLWGQYFGTKGDAIAAILDPKVATQVIQDRGTQVAIGGAAASHGIDLNQQSAQQLQQAGVTADQAKQGFNQIATAMPTDQAIAGRFGTQFGLGDEVNSVFLGDADATRKRQTMYDEEQALFKTNSGINANSLSVSQEH